MVTCDLDAYTSLINLVLQTRFAPEKLQMVYSLVAYSKQRLAYGGRKPYLKMYY